jgi:hypothetical protein
MSNAAQPGEGAQTAGLADQAQDLASNLTQTAKARATGLVEEQKAAAADQVEGVARLLDDVAGRVEQGAPAVAPLLREAASSVHRVSSSLRDRSVDDVLQQFGEFARRRPGALIGASLIGGFAIARFLKSSADRRSSRAQDLSGSSQHRPAGLPGPPPGRTHPRSCCPTAGRGAG